MHTVDNLSSDIRDYYLNQLNKGSDITPPDIKILSGRYRGFNLFRLKIKAVFFSLTDFSVFNKIFYFLKKLKINSKKEYLSCQIEPDFNKKYIYVALHYQPECSTSPLGGPFVDQVLMIRILSSAVPRDWLVYVKEHPYQWLPRGLAYSGFRYEGYYKSIVEMSNVRLIPVESNTEKLIENAQTVATVTGTAGWEAALRLKPALVFGHAWYRDCPGVFRVDGLDSCRAAINKIISGRRADRQEIINYLVSLDKVTFHGYFEPLVQVQSKLTSEEHVNNFVDAIASELNKYINN